MFLDFLGVVITAWMKVLECCGLLVGEMFFFGELIFLGSLTAGFGAHGRGIFDFRAVLASEQVGILLGLGFRALEFRKVEGADGMGMEK